MSIPLEDIIFFIDDVEVIYKIILEKMGIETKYI
jgi:hypothetical protein